MDFAGFTINANVDIWVVISLFGIICYFFGRLIADVKPPKVDELTAYSDGFLFIGIYIIFPVLIINTFGLDTSLASTLTQWGKIPIVIALAIQGLIQISLLFVLGRKFSGLELLKYSLKDTISNAIRKKATDIKVGKNVITSDQVISGTDFARNYYFTPLPPVWAFVCSSIVGYCLLLVTAIKLNELSLAFSFFLGFLNMSMIAILVNYPKEYATAELDCNGTIRTGKLIKFNSDFITITDDNNIYHINRDIIHSIKIKAYDKERVDRELGLK